MAQTWARSGGGSRALCPDLRKDNLHDFRRKTLVDQLAEAVREELEIPVHWRTMTIEEEEEEEGDWDIRD